MRSLKEIREEQNALLSAYHDKRRVLDEEEKKAVLHKQKNCPHPAEKVVVVTDPGYFEQGRMSHPLPDTQYKKCRRCGARIAVLVSHSTESWQPLSTKF